MNIYILFLHWIADFVCQTSWMAHNKSKNGQALGLHVLVYTLVMFFGLNILYRDIWYLLTYVAVNGFVHLYIDLVSSQITAYYKDVNRHAFFACIGLDQFIHGATLLLTMPILGI